MKINRMKDISDNKLAQFIDGNTTNTETNEILDAIQSEEDLETITLAFSAQKILNEEDDNLDDMPEINTLGKIIQMNPFERLPMTGFSGNSADDNTDDSDNETNK
jgi:hypothetical protein